MQRPGPAARRPCERGGGSRADGRRDARGAGLRPASLLFIRTRLCPAGRKSPLWSWQGRRAASALHPRRAGSLLPVAAEGHVQCLSLLVVVASSVFLGSRRGRPGPWLPGTWRRTARASGASYCSLLVASGLGGAHPAYFRKPWGSSPCEWPGLREGPSWI